MAFVYVDYPPEFRDLLAKIMNDGFMAANTKFPSFEGFRYSSAVFVNWNSDPLVYNEEVFDNFVKESTRFGSWNEMMHTATKQYFQSQETS